jgi:hypothetical protein
VDETIKKLEQQDKKLDAIYASAEKTRKYLLWTLTITVAVIVVPLIGFPSRYRCFSATTSSDSSGSAGSLARSCATKGAHDCSRRRYDGAGSYPAVRGWPSAGRSAPHARQR